MSLELLQSKIQQSIEISDTQTEANRNKQLSTILNNLTKSNCIQDEHLDFQLRDGLDQTILSYKKWMIEQGKKDLKGGTKQVRRLSVFYCEKMPIDIEVTYTQLLQSAAVRKYGTKLIPGIFSRKERNKILDTHITYSTVANEIVRAALDEDPRLFEHANKDNNLSITAAARQIKEQLEGKSMPGSNFPSARISFIERFFSLPTNSLLFKVDRKTDHQRRGKKTTELDDSVKKRVENNFKHLNKNLQLVFDEYSAYKIHETQPELRFIPDKYLNSRYSKQLCSLGELEQAEEKKSRKWTINAKEECAAQKLFHSELLRFQHICVVELGYDFNEVGTYHLTNPDVISKVCEFTAKRPVGGNTMHRFMNFIHRSCKDRGYLFFNGERGERTEDEFADDLMFIVNKYAEYRRLCREGMGKRGSNAAKGKGKENIQFLLKMDWKERKEAIEAIAAELERKAEIYNKEMQFKLKAAQDSRTEKAKNEYLKSAAHKSQKAYRHMFIALILRISYIQIPRALNWTMLKYYPSQKAKDYSYSSITYHREKGAYELYIPTYGTSLADPSKTVRYLKNSDHENTTNIDVMLPKRLTPTIKKYIAYRESYIENDVYFHIERDSAEAKMIEPDMLFPWRRVLDRDSDLSAQRQLLKDKLICDEFTLGDAVEHLTYTACLMIFPDTKQHGINIHGLRHLTAETHLEQYPGDIDGAAAKLNDSKALIEATYGNQDRAKDMRRVALLEE